MNAANHARMSIEEVKARFDHARKHLEFSAQLYRIQWQAGRHLLHEHPESASSWQGKCIQHLMKEVGTMKVIGDECKYGLQLSDGRRVGPARKSIGFMTSPACIANELNKRCPNRGDSMCTNM